MAQTISVSSRGYVSQSVVDKAPNDTVIIKVDFGLFFGAATASTLTVTPDSGLTVGTTSVASNVATIPVSGGTNCNIYDLSVKLAGASETKEVVIQVRVRDMTTLPVDDYGMGCC